MIKYQTVMVKQNKMKSVICDVCKNELIYDLDIQEMHLIDFVGGYTSVFGDMNTVKCDICQDCLYRMIKDYCRYE